MPDDPEVTDALALTLDRVAIGALTGVSLKVAPGEIVCLSGASGSGKSRLLRAIADLDPHDGEVRLGERTQAQLPGHAWRRAVMLVPAESQWWAERVGDHFAESAADDDATGLAALGFTLETLDWQVARLSSGEKQRLALLRALSRRPRALLLDEPTANLDDDATRATEAWLGQEVRRLGLAVLWVAHDPRQIARVARRHYRIEGDRLEEAPWA